MSTFELLDREKFAVLAIENVATNVQDWEGQLSDGTWILTKAPLEVDSRWQEWVGSIRVEQLKRANLVLVRKSPSTNPGLLDETHNALSDYLSQLFSMLQLSGVLQYDAADLFTGSVVYGKAEIRQLSRVPDFYPTKGYSSSQVDLERLQEAVKLRATLPELYSQSGNFRRVARGLNVLMDGLKQSRGEERLHQFVRSLEALILPSVGKTKRQFIHRCQTFAEASHKSADILKEAFDLRSQAEHLNDWAIALKSYPIEDREYIALQRTYQMQKLACFAYLRILIDMGVRAHFKTETAMHSFWKQPDYSRIATWGNQLNLAIGSQ